MNILFLTCDHTGRGGVARDDLFSGGFGGCWFNIYGGRVGSGYRGEVLWAESLNSE